MSTADESWYFTQSGERKGPISQELLNELVAKGKLNAENDLVWGPGLLDWTKSGDVEGLKPAYAALKQAQNEAEIAKQDATGSHEPQLEAPPQAQVSADSAEVDDTPPPPPSVPEPSAIVKQKAQKQDDEDLLAQAMDARRENARNQRA